MPADIQVKVHAITPWASSMQAAREIGISKRTLHRRIQASHWREGVHYRWITKAQRRVIQVHMPNVTRLLVREGW